MATGLPPPPLNDPSGSYAWLEWFRTLRNYISTTGSVPWSIINFAGSDIADIANRSHSSLQGLQGGTVGERYHLTQLESDHIYDPSTPPTQFGWKDLLGSIIVKGVGGGGAGANPDYVIYRGNIYAYRWGTLAPNNHLHEAFIEFHIPHDYAPGTDMYIHIHWSQATVDTGGPAGVPGTAKWYFDISYAKGHGTAGGSGDAFNAPVTVSLTQQASTTQYGHMIGETIITDDGTLLIDRDRIEVDGLVLVRVYRDPADAADTLNQDTFVHFVDIHYQSTGLNTLNKAPNFYA